MNTITLTVLLIIFALIVLSPFIVLFVIARMPDEEPVCSLDCRDWSRFGLTDPDCTATHETTHFASPRAQVEFENAFDNQIGVHRG